MSTNDLPLVLDAVDEPVLLVDRDRIIVHANRPAENAFGHSLVGQPFVRALRHPQVLECLDRVLAGEERARTQMRLAPPEQTTYSVTAVHLASNNPAVAITLRDVSPLLEAAQMRSDFVANVSHELRSPLTTLTGLIETLQGAAKDDPEARSRFLEIMERESSRMDRLIGDLLSLSNVEGQERVQPTEMVDLRQIINGVISTLAERREGKDRELIFESTAELCPVFGDADQLVQVFQNLIENALKYASPEGAVTVTLDNVEQAPGFGGRVWSIAVQDQGEGIHPEHLPRLTERFYRIDSGRSRQMGGTGLGLAIVKHIVNRHRGRLKISSVLGQGTRITVLLPEAE